MSGGDADDATEFPVIISPCYVFWDVAGFPFPNGLSPASIPKKMETSLEQIGFSGNLLIKVYVGEENFSDLNDYKKAGITIVRRQVVESARNYSLVVDVALWLFDNGMSPCDAIIISKSMENDEDFLQEYRYYRFTQHNVYVFTSKVPNFEWLCKSLGENPIDVSFDEPLEVECS